MLFRFRWWFTIYENIPFSAAQKLQQQAWAEDEEPNVEVEKKKGEEKADAGDRVSTERQLEGGSRSYSSPPRPTAIGGLPSASILPTVEGQRRHQTDSTSH